MSVETWEELGDAAPLVGALMEQSRQHTDQVTARVIEGVERERDEWMERAFAAEDRLLRVERRLMAVLA